MGKYYLDETKQGYKIAEWYTYKKAPYGLIVLVKRPKDWVVGWGYDMRDGRWAQGHYDFASKDEAVEFIRDNYSGALRTSKDAIVEQVEDYGVPRLATMKRRKAELSRNKSRMMTRRNAAANADEARKLIHDLLVKHSYVKDEGDTVVYSNDYIYDYEMPLKTAYAIVLAKDPWQAFDDEIFNDGSYDSWYLDNIDYLADEVERYAEQDGVDLDRVEINEYISDVVYIEADDISNLYRQELPCRLVIDTGDSNTEFTENPYYEDFGREGYTMPQNASLRWLCEQLGVDVNVINEHIADASYDRLNNVEISIVKEVENTSGDINAVTFIVRCELEQLINWTEKKTDVVIPKGTWCGLFDPFNGGGSIFEIVINKPVTIPANIIYELVPDATGYGEYGFIDVYGMDEGIGTLIDLEQSANKSASMYRRNRRRYK